jgi:hypothetical protein
MQVNLTTGVPPKMSSALPTIRIGKAERPRESILNGPAFVGACTAGSDGYKQVRLHVAGTLHMITYPQYMGLVQDILI